MKKKILTISLAVIFGLAAIFSIVIIARRTAREKFEEFEQNLNYTESTEKINNPDQGFYRPIYVKLTADGATYNKAIVTANTQLYHLRADISAFSTKAGGEDKPLTDGALNGVKELLQYLTSRGKNAVVRFAYDAGFGGNSNAEAELSMILTHAEQVCAVTNSFPECVTAIEEGMIGPWGEMHTSKIATAENISRLTETFLNGAKAPVLVRTPKMIYNYIAAYGESEKTERIGIFNDGYLGSSSDLGTYSDREKDIEFLSARTERLPFGGEVVIPNSPLHDIDKCLPEMFKLNLSYLNVEWNNQVIDKWKNSYYTAECGGDEKYYGSSAFTYIENRLGYRFYVTDSTFAYSDKGAFKARLKIRNAGFGNLNKAKFAKLIFVNGDEKKEFSVGRFNGGEIVTYSCKPKLNAGEYDVYLCLYGKEEEGAPNYALRFANPDVWNEDLQANKIGSFKT